ncbi:DNA helicase/exodeoxyribonuclease V subunit A [Bacillus oleivorans]|uniref:ATP-dependent helicase/nuclease subunit A n=1 Tax=Bacillus oleivorans TaxID=1448271 RepID=A0A285CRE3_9BACI|nr:helicase-exonuclease AddAB subunit AddA [Bacillus oleivorans]SNX70064.1 DNA helicase/exodeoxyribonuclease V subunit A [Bacillus oleivorans]
MNKPRWTENQEKAIFASGKDILVAAAAGSGKTAVLVERIIQKLMDEEHGYNVDELLVVTFTNASAAEMRHRIGNALEAAIKENPHSLHLRKQLTLLNRASISTLHSFCLDVVRKYYYLVDLDPNFRIADSSELALIQDEVMDELLEDSYAMEDSEEFYQLVDVFADDRSDLPLQVIIRNLYEFSRANPNPNEWFKKLIELYDIQPDTGINDLSFTKTIMESILMELNAAKSMLEQAIELAALPGGPQPKIQTYEQDIAFVQMLREAAEIGWDTLYQTIQAQGFLKAVSVKKADYDEELLKQTDTLRKKAKELVEKIKEQFFSRKPDSYLNDIRSMKPIVEGVVRLVQRYHKKFQAVKMEKSLIDFGDLEHFCLSILMEENKPSKIAKAFQERFKEILVDEYQDTNLVQETIIQLIKKGSEQNGNLFMVGDVKQSIYKFRLAEPQLFIEKYRSFWPDVKAPSGLRIDLAQNFRSRDEVLHGTNFIFKQTMGEKVGDIEYTEDAELKVNDLYPPSPFPISVILIEKDGQNDDLEENQEEDLEKSQLEARFIAKEIRALIDSGEEVYDPKIGSYRQLQFRDIVILLRSMPWAQTIMDECKELGIPVYADLSDGYFEATEVAIMLSLLKIIDNPQQDIPLAAVLRSPIVGMDEEELALVRIAHKKGSYFEAFTSFINDEVPEHSAAKKKGMDFLNYLENWRVLARRGTLSELIWQIYQDTKFLEYVGGLPGGKQRQANLRALYDRARVYETTSFRGLFRFLRFVERLQERGEDLGTARSIGEQDDVVRLMTIHRSKGLEFPYVFIAGLNKNFNMKDVQSSTLLDKELGIAMKYVDPIKRLTYPSLPQLAFARKKRLESLSEEMRILYVALTRAKEKLYLLGTISELGKSVEKWSLSGDKPGWLLPDFVRSKASSYLDWIGPALLRSKDIQEVLSEMGLSSPYKPLEHPSRFELSIISAPLLMSNDSSEKQRQNGLEAVRNGEPVGEIGDKTEALLKQMTWEYSYQSVTSMRSKMSVSELKRQREWVNREEMLPTLRRTSLFDRPSFLQEKRLTPTERGTAMHLVMQHVPLQQEVTLESIHALLNRMITIQLLTEEQAKCIDPEQILNFFESNVGARMLKAPAVYRELPFSFVLPVEDQLDEKILIQGIIDCLFEDEQGLVLIDFKSDTITGKYPNGFEQAKPELIERYKTQIELYKKAVEKIVVKPLQEACLYFFDGGHQISFINEMNNSKT